MGNPKEEEKKMFIQILDLILIQFSLFLVCCLVEYFEFFSPFLLCEKNYSFPWGVFMTQPFC